MILLLTIMFLLSLGSAILITHFFKKFTKKSRYDWLYWLLNVLIFVISFFGFILLTTYIVFGRVDGLFDRGSLNFSLTFVELATAFWIMKICGKFTSKNEYPRFWNFLIFIGAFCALWLISDLVLNPSL